MIEDEVPLTIQSSDLENRQMRLAFTLVVGRDRMGVRSSHEGRLRYQESTSEIGIWGSGRALGWM